jgi:hypothetical protein
MLPKIDADAWKIEKNLKTTPKHSPSFVKFHDYEQLRGRFQNTNITNAGGYYYSKWLHCINTAGADNEHCRKCRYIAERFASSYQLNEWDDWVKEEHTDLAIGQHGTRLDCEHFIEASTAMKSLKEKRDELVKSVALKLNQRAAEDSMVKIRSELIKAEDKTAGIAGLIQEGKLSDADVSEAIQSKMAQLKALNDESKWHNVCSNLTSDLTSFAKMMKTKLRVLSQKRAEQRAMILNAGEVPSDVPHFRVNYEMPGIYEYNTWFGQYVPRTWQYGYVATEEE